MNRNRISSQGMYRPEFEHDGCGIGLVAHLKGKASHDIVHRGLKVLENLHHRGAESADNITGDGAGILTQLPHKFFQSRGIAIPSPGKYAAALVFLPNKPEELDACIAIIKKHCEALQLDFFHIREVPYNNDSIGGMALESKPEIKQLFIKSDFEQEVFERKLYIVRKKIENEIRHSNLTEKKHFYFPSLSSKRIIYKGMLTSLQVREFFKDLSDTNYESAIALVHSRFSTNTFPSWDLAQPFRFIGHNGEINTIKGNRFWMEARESLLKSELLGDLNELYPIIEPDMSDSASLDNALEFLVMAGKSIPHALSMLVPESWNKKNPIPENVRSFYQYHSTLMEPWDGPASLIFSDGRYIGGMLDRNGLRPSRYLITTDDLFVMGSETGVQEFDNDKVREKGRLKPGKLLFIDTQEGFIQQDYEIKQVLAKQHAYSEWLQMNMVDIEDIPFAKRVSSDMGSAYSDYMKVFDYSKEDIEYLITPMVHEGKEPIGSMGNDAPLSIISENRYSLFSYFRQLFAQVTNPPIDPIREELVMTLTSYIGSLQKNILDEQADHVKMIMLKNPVISNTQFEIIKNLRYKGFSTVVIPFLYPVKDKEEGLRKAIDEICLKAEQAVDDGKNYVILSDRGVTEELAPIPSLLIVSAVHHYLINKRKRLQCNLVVETGEAREVMHFALLFGYGASLVNPYLAFGVIHDLVKSTKIHLDYDTARKHYIKAINGGLLKILSKMGISTLRSYRGAQIFEAVGLNKDLIETYFSGTTTRIGGIGLKEIADDIYKHNHSVYKHPEKEFRSEPTGLYMFRKAGEKHSWNPESIGLLQWATRTGNYKKYKEYTSIVDNKPNPVFIRDFLDFKRNPIDISEVEPIESITKRFVTGAMSYGSISREAHETLALAMNAIGGRSNTGEGGEDPERFKKRPDGSSLRSAIKQVASGRFGVTTEYLVNADELQIKVAQGAKPGEGGQLPGYKVDKIIAKTRYSIPGISLISPPPHHDIYSIEDLAQLIFDLKNVNPNALVSVKLVSEAGVGTVAAGVAKAKADLITISGCEGGTGASPVSSIKYAGLPMEMGIAEVQQTLVMNNLRGKVRLQTDGQLKTGRDVVIAAMLGAEEFGFSTSALIVLGCVMMRKCHLNTCPVGVATQDVELRKHFNGKADYLVNFFKFIAEEVREHLASIGVRSMDEIVGRTDLLFQVDKPNHSKSKLIDLSELLYFPKEAAKYSIHHSAKQIHKIDNVLDRKLIQLSAVALEKQQAIVINEHITNVDRTAGAMLSGEVAKRYGYAGLPDNTIHINLDGSAGQSFGAFLAHGITLHLKGDANDYLGKGLSGGRIIVAPPAGSTFKPEENIIVGNTLLYGATGGEVFINGRAGERFAVRNSGATAVVEGVGDHGCEYMTGGRVVVLGPTGRNFAAGMSGGIAYVYDKKGRFDYYCNIGMVEISLVEELVHARELKALIKKHVDLTGSPKGAMMLNDWDEYLQHFIQVTPIEYKKVLQEEKLKAIDEKIKKVEFDY